MRNSRGSETPLCEPRLRMKHLTLCAMMAALVVTPVGAVTVIGLSSSVAVVDGTRVPSGTTILGPATVVSAEGAVIIHLTNGALLALDPESEVHLEALEDGSLRVGTDSGFLTVRELNGELMTVAAGSALTVDPGGKVLRGTERDISVGTESSGGGVGLAVLAGFIIDEADNEKDPPGGPTTPGD